MFYLTDQPTDEQFAGLAKRYEDMEPGAVRAMVRLLRVGSDLLTAFERLLGRYGLSQGRFLTLVVLHREPDRVMTPSEVAASVGVKRATMTRLLDGLEREGLVRRQAHGEDGRRVDLMLTDQGRARLEAVLPDYWRRVARLMRGLSGAEQAVLVALLGKAAAGIPALGEEAIRVSRNAPETAIGCEGVAIGPYRPDHPTVAAQIGKLISGIQREEFGMAITLADQPDLADITGFYCQGAGGFWTARVRDEVVGVIALKDIGQGLAALRKMFVAKAWRGRDKRVAAGLLQTLVAHAAVQGVRRIYLGTTDRFAAAHRFYARNGFVAVSRADLPSSFPVMAVDTRFFVLDVETALRMVPPEPGARAGS